MNYAEIKKLDVANTKGISTTLFVSGCTHNCNLCFNKEVQDFNYGNKWTINIEDEFIQYCNSSYVYNVAILGGEPMQQDYDIMLNLLKRIKLEVNKPIWLWSGYTYSQILTDKKRKELLKYIDVLIDGKFIEELKDLTLKHRGSSNQKIIDVQKSLLNNKVILFNY